MINKLTIAVFALFLLITFGVSESSAQSDKSVMHGKKIKLKKGARKNGFETSEKGKKYFFQANNIFDPFNKKILEGEHELQYRCKSETSVRKRDIKLSKGMSQRVSIACAVIIDARILLLDEPNAN